MKIKTSDMHKAAFLMVKGATLTGTERINMGRMSFILSGPTVNEDSVAFDYGEDDTAEVMVDARRYQEALKRLKTRIYTE